MLDEKAIGEIVKNVRAGIRTPSELEKCGCPYCKEALRRLNE